MNDVVPDDVEAAVREAVLKAPGRSITQLVKVLPASYRAFAAAVRSAAERLAGADALFPYVKGRTTLFFSSDPMAVLDATVPSRLGVEPLDKDELKQLAEGVAPGHGTVIDAWLKRALAAGTLHEHAPKAKGKKRYGARPDLRRLFAPLFSAVRKARDSLDARGIPREQFAELLLEELGVATGADAADPAEQAGSAKGGARARFISALAALGAENPRQALLSVRELRARVGLGKEQFDDLALELMREGGVSLHHHDHPSSLAESERRQLIQDASGTYYVGIAPRSRS